MRWEFRHWNLQVLFNSIVSVTATGLLRQQQTVAMTVYWFGSLWICSHWPDGDLHSIAKLVARQWRIDQKNALCVIDSTDCVTVCATELLVTRNCESYSMCYTAVSSREL
jgi:hypothetical protein